MHRVITVSFCWHNECKARKENPHSSGFPLKRRLQLRLLASAKCNGRPLTPPSMKSEISPTTDFDQHVFPTFEQTLFTLDLAGNFKFVSAAAERLTGYSREQLGRLNVVDLLPGASLRALDDLLKRNIVEGFGTVFEVEITTSDRRQIRIEASIDLVRRRDGALEFHGIAVPQVDEKPTRQIYPQDCEEEYSFEFIAEQFDRQRIYL